MSFTQAISDGFSKYATFTGRSSRSAYWWWALFAFILGIASYAIGLAIDNLIIYYVVALALLLPNVAVGVRRLHDIDRSGWWYLIVLIPIIGGIVLLVWFAQPSKSSSKYGAGPDGASAVGTPDHR